MGRVKTACDKANTMMKTALELIARWKSAENDAAKIKELEDLTTDLKDADGATRSGSESAEKMVQSGYAPPSVVPRIVEGVEMKITEEGAKAYGIEAGAKVKVLGNGTVRGTVFAEIEGVGKTMIAKRQLET
jgi:hypothetical protein